jgi:hypothetical protein
MGVYQLQLTRILKTPGRHTLELYLFVPPETHLSARTLAEPQFFFGSIAHRFGLLGIHTKDRASKSDTSYALLSPHFETTHGSWLFRYKASMDRLRQQLQSADTAVAEPIGRALRLSQTFAKRMRKTAPQQDKQSRYFRQMDIYFSWFAEQFFLECMTLKEFPALNEELRQAIADFLQQEAMIRKERDYVREFQGSPTALWNRMSLYNRLLEYPVTPRSKIVELGSGTRKLVKAATTMVIMSLFTYLLFNAREASNTLSITVLLGIALIYAIRDLLRDDAINVITRWLRQGKPRWKIRLFMPYTRKLLAQQLIWLDYRKLSELPRNVTGHPIKWPSSDDGQVICYRSLLNLDQAALEQDEIGEHLTLDCELLCKMIKASRDRLFVYAGGDDPAVAVQVHPIERQQDYNLLLVSTQPGQNYTSAQRWRLRLGSNGIVQCKSKEAQWPSPEKQKKQGWWDSMATLFKRK